MVSGILEQYGVLLAGVDRWFAGCLERYPDATVCRSGCAECCRGLFDITLLDACYLKHGFDRLPAEVLQLVAARAAERLRGLQGVWPEFSAPFTLNYRPEEEWEALMPEDDETPCVLLGEDGRCLVYAYRPMTCRLHGLPLIDCSGEVMFDEWCTLNFAGLDPLGMDGLRWEFNGLFREELLLFHRFTKRLLGERVNELDTFIPTALLVDFTQFDWRGWWECKGG